MRNSLGATLVETLAWLGILGGLLVLAIPTLGGARRRADLENLARQLISDTNRCRAHAIGSQRRVGLVFTQWGKRWTYCGVVDGDHDGVSRKDLQRGIDRELFPRVDIGRLCLTAQLGVPTGWHVPDPSGMGQLRPGDGLRAGRAEIISFSPLGDATPATVYFNDGLERMLALRHASAPSNGAGDGRSGAVCRSKYSRSEIRRHSNAAASAPAALRSLRRITCRYASVARLAGVAHRRSRCVAIFPTGSTKPDCSSGVCCDRRHGRACTRARGSSPRCELTPGPAARGSRTHPSRAYHVDRLGAEGAGW
jgi:type II secretory pathway pseudopilin PulG